MNVFSMLSLLLFTTLAVAAPVNDDLSAALTIESLPYSQQQHTQNSSQEPQEVQPSCAHNSSGSLWYQYTADTEQSLLLDTFGADYDTVLSVWQGRAHPLTLLACNDDDPHSGEKRSQLILSTERNKTYYINISGYDGDRGQSILNINKVHPLTNDTLEQAVVLKAYDRYVQTTQGAQSDEPLASCQASGAGVWFHYTPETTQQVIVDTLGSDYDTVLSVWDAQGQELACDDNIYDTLQSQVKVKLTADSNYYIQVAGVKTADLAASGLLALTLQLVPLNDEPDQALIIDQLPYHHQQDTTQATQALTEPNPSCAPLNQATVWYQYTPTITEQVRFSTLDSLYDTVLSVWTQSEADWRELACNDDALTLDEYQSAAQLSLAVQAGQTYYINVAGLAGESGELVFTAESIRADLNLFNVPTTQTIAAGEIATLTVSAKGSKPIIYQWYQGIQGDVSTPLINHHTLTTAPLNQTQYYWVRATNPTGSVDSETITVSVGGHVNSRGVNAQGASIATQADFIPLIHTQSGKKDNFLTLTPSETATATMTLIADQAHQGQQVELVIFAYYETDTLGPLAYQLDQQQGWLSWDESIAHLTAAESKFRLRQQQTITLYEGSLEQVLAGKTQVYVGYRLNNGSVIYSEQPLEFILK